VKPLLVVRHVPWEGPHRLLDAFEGVPVRLVDGLVGADPLPSLDEVCGAVFMGGPMSANDTRRYPRLREELRWLRDAVEAELAVLGICLGSQLLARALGSRILPGPKEIGFAPVEVLDESDPLLAPLAPTSTVLHWHGEVFELPAGATLLARSAATQVQAFRAGSSAWGLLFHAEADLELVERWLEEPSMAAEACETLGPPAECTLRADAGGMNTAAGSGVFVAFASRCSHGHL